MQLDGITATELKASLGIVIKQERSLKLFKKNIFFL